MEERQLEIEEKMTEPSILPQRIQEAQMVMDQLTWLLEISENLKGLVRKILDPQP